MLRRRHHGSREIRVESARIIFVLLLMLIPGSQILIYPVLWILMPSEDAVGTDEWRAATSES